MEKQERRIDAIRRYLQGEKISSICRDLGRSRRWFYYWLKRYNPSDPAWPRSHTRAPRQVSTKTPEEVERLVYQIRQPYDLHQLDLVDPRHLQGGQRFYGVHLIDAFSNAVALETVPSKRAVDIVEAPTAAPAASGCSFVCASTWGWKRPV